MSAPETNVNKQKRRHRPVLLMILAAVVLVLLASFATGIWVNEDVEDDAAADLEPGAAAIGE